MARERTLPDDVYAGILKRLAGQGYDPARFALVPQLREQMPAAGETVRP
jgi:hypothetical protein